MDTFNNTSLYSIYEQGIKGGPGGGPSGLLNFSIGNNLQAKILKKTDSSSKFENTTWIENFNISGNYNFLNDTQRLSMINVTAFTKLFNQINVNANARLNPYAKRNIEGREVYIKTFQWSEDKRLGTWTNASIQMNTGLNADMFRKHQSDDTTGKIKSEKDKQEYEQMRRYPSAYVNFDLPWSLNVNYSLNYNRINYISSINQTFTFSGDFNLTPKWKIGCSSGYDFNEKKIAYTQFEVSRLIHCWAINFNWIPDGIRKSFTFSLKVNASILQSLKVDKKRYWFDQ